MVYMGRGHYIHYIISSKKISFFLLFLLSDQRLLPGLIYAGGHVWKERRIKMVRNREAEVSQIEVRGRSQPGKRDKFNGHILHPLSGTLTHWKTPGLQKAPAGFAVPSAGQQRRGWPAMHDNYPRRDPLPSPSTAYPDKQGRAPEVCSPEMLVIGEFSFILLLWSRLENEACWLCDWNVMIFTRQTKKLAGPKCKYRRQRGQMVWERFKGVLRINVEWILEGRVIRKNQWKNETRKTWRVFIRRVVQGL